MINFSGSKDSRTYAPILIGILLSVSCLSLPAYALKGMTKQSMSQVTGREGLALDINLKGSVETAEFKDANGISGGSGNGVLRIGDSSDNITLGDGTGNPASLTGVTLDVDGSGNGSVVLGLPSGKVTTSLPAIKVVGTLSSASGGPYFGDLSVEGMDFGDNPVTLSGKADGLTIDVDGNNPIELGTLRWLDPDGLSGSEGDLALANLRIHDTEYTSWTATGFGLDNDYSKGIVLSAPNSMDDLGITTGLMTNGSRIVTVAVGGGGGGIDATESELYLKGIGDGFDVTPVISINSIDRSRIIDPDGFGTSGQSDIRSLGIKIGDVFGHSEVDPANIGTHTINFDSSKGIVITPPTRSTSITKLDVSIPAPQIEDGPPTLKVDLGNLDWRDSMLGITEGGSYGNGLTLNLQLYLTLNEIRLTDTDGFSGTNAGFLSVGYRGTGQGIVINDGSGNPADLSGINLDVSPTDGAVLTLPDGSSNFGNVTTVIDKVTLGDASTELGSFDARNMNFQGSRFQLEAH